MVGQHVGEGDCGAKSSRASWEGPTAQCAQDKNILEKRCCFQFRVGKLIV